MGAAARRRRTAALCRRGRGPPSRARRLAGYRTAPPPSRRLDRPCRPDPVAGGVLPARSASLRTGWKTGSGLKNHLARREKPFSISCLRACSLLTRAGRQKRRGGSQQGDARAASELRVTVYRIRRDHGARMTMSASGGGPDQEPHRRPGHNLARRSIEALPRGREVSVRSARELHCVCQKRRRRLQAPPQIQECRISLHGLAATATASEPTQPDEGAAEQGQRGWFRDRHQRGLRGEVNNGAGPKRKLYLLSHRVWRGKGSNRSVVALTIVAVAHRDDGGHRSCVQCARAVVLPVKRINTADIGHRVDGGAGRRGGADIAGKQKRTWRSRRVHIVDVASEERHRLCCCSGVCDRYGGGKEIRLRWRSG